MYISFRHFTAILSTQLVRAVFALKCVIGHFPEPGRMDEHSQLPYHHYQDSNTQQSPCEKSRNKQERREHHEVIPVEYPACGTALIAQEKPERTPEKYADKICHIEKRHEYQYDCFPN